MNAQSLEREAPRATPAIPGVQRRTATRGQFSDLSLKRSSSPKRSMQRRKCLQAQADSLIVERLSERGAKELEDIHRGSFMHLKQMHARQFPEHERERNDAISVALAPVDPYLTPLQIDIAEAHIDQLTDAHSGIEQHFDEHHIRELAGFPRRNR